MHARVKHRLTFGAIVLVALLGGLLSGYWDNHLLQISFGHAKPDQVLQNAFRSCRGENTRTRGILCFKKEITPAVKSGGMAPLVRALEQRYLEEDFAKEGGITACHDMLHAIGQLGVGYSKNYSNTLNDCTNICTSGCYHGVVEGLVSLGQRLSGNLAEFCAISRDRQKNSACYHGLGHGFASLSGFDLTKALKLCNEIKDTRGPRDCGAGVIMELFEPASFADSPLKFPEDIPEFCRKLSPPHDETCEETSGLHEYARRQDEQKAIATCDKVIVSRQANCLAALGQNMYFVFQGDTRKIISFCALVRGNLQRSCLAGALEASVMSDPLARHGFEICESLFEEQNWCYKKLGEKIEHYHGAEQRKTLCLAKDKTCL